MMTKPKETPFPIAWSDISELIKAASNPCKESHEIVIPAPVNAWDEVIVGYTADFIAGDGQDYVAAIFGYSIRLDPSAYSMDILMKRDYIPANPLPFDESA
jgi:hypothetical protein